MAKSESKNDITLKLNYKRTSIIGFAFFGILLLWQVYDSWCGTLLTELFKKTYGGEAEDYQYLVGIIMAMDNLFALFLLPIFGSLSDKTNTPIGKRMPFILVGTFVCAIAFPFIPVFYTMNSIVGVVITMFIVLVFAMMYRNPAVALMPDITPKPLRSKANGIINIMGYLGGAFATVCGIFFSLSKYLTDKGTWHFNNFWALEAPFLIGSVLMTASAIFLFVKIKENKIAEEMKNEMELGEKMSELEDKVEENKKLSKKNAIMICLILLAEFFWFMADNAVGTFMNNYTQYYMYADTAKSSVNTIIMGVGSVIGFAVGGKIAEKIGRKWTLFIGLGLSLVAYLAWGFLSIKGWSKPLDNEFNAFPVYLYGVFFIKGLGMSLVHVNSFPMVVEFATKNTVGKFTGYYYAASMAAQTVTPMLLGLLLLTDFNFGILPFYASICIFVSICVFFFVGNLKGMKREFKKGLSAFDQED